MPEPVAAKTDPAAALMTEEAINGFFNLTPDTPTPEATATETAPPSDGTKTTTDTVPATASKTEAPPTPAADQATDDLSGYAEVLQRSLKALSPEDRALARKELDKGYMRRSDYTVKTQKVAEVERNAQAFDAAMKNPALRKAWNDILNAPAQADAGQSDEQEVEALSKAALEADGKALATILAKRDARLRAEAQAAAERVYEDRAVKPVQRFKDVEAALQARIDETGISADAVRDAARKAVKYPANGPIESWDPAKAWDLIAPFLPEANVKVNTPPAPSRAAPPIPKVAPPGRGASAAAPAPLPAHRREGRQPKTNSEHAEEFAHLLSEQLGRQISVSDLENAR